MTWRWVGVRPIMMYDNDRGADLKDVNVKAKFEQE